MNKRNEKITGVIVLLLAFLVTRSTAFAESASGDPLALSLEELMDVEVYSVSKKPERLINAAAAIYVLTYEDIRRSGARSIPEALRMVPGLSVARINGNSWSVSSRGYNGRYSNKLLVLMDGRTIYSGVFSGVSWDEHNILLDDIDRIEVIRGPGGTLWGANAVNGVINIITKSAKDTEGVYVTGALGTEHRDLEGVRAGTKIGESGYVRLFAKHTATDSQHDPLGGEAHDKADYALGGFRSDWQIGADDEVTLQGFAFQETVRFDTVLPSPRPPFTEIGGEPNRNRGGNVLGRWNHTISEDSELSIQLYFDRTDRAATQLSGFEVNTYDGEFQHRFKATDRLGIIWGGAYRSIHDEIRSSEIVSYMDDKRQTSITSGFTQLEYELVPESLRLISGVKLENSPYTGTEVQPNARILYMLDQHQTLWAAYSRALRTPSRVDNSVDGVIAYAPISETDVTEVRIFGNQDFKSEQLNAYEVGYRAQVSNDVQVDIASFIFDYNHLSTTELKDPFVEMRSGMPAVITPVVFGNEASGLGVGGEIALTVSATEWWRIQGTYSYLNLDLDLSDTSTDTAGFLEEDQNPEHQVGVRSRMDLPGEVELDMFLRYVDRLSEPDVDSYIELDVRVARELIKGLELAVVGQNLLHDEHLEFDEGLLAPRGTESERGVYGQLTWRY